MYPIPEQDQINIELKSERDMHGNLIITNLGGQVLLNHIINLNRSINTKTLDTKFLDPGIHILQIHSNQRNLITNKLVK